MVIEKLDSLETSLRGILEELADLRGSRDELESRIEKAQDTARSATNALSGRDGEISKLRQENNRLNKERDEVRNKVKRILHRFPGE